MLQSAKQLYGRKLGTSEGEIGHVEDFYFNDQPWIVRYVVADTGSWLRGRLVLLSPHAFGDFYQEGDSLLVNLTRQQIENSPAMESHKPVSRQFEEEYFRHYGWPSYWQGGAMRGVADLPLAPPPHLLAHPEGRPSNRPRGASDPHLRSTKALDGYHIQTPEGPIGFVTDLMLDDKSWSIRHLVVETGHWFSRREIAISPKHIDWISYTAAKVYVNVTKEVIQNATEYHMPPAAYHESRNFGD